MNIQITRNSSPLRTGLYYLAMLVGVALTILLVACPTASSNDSGGALGRGRVTLTSAATDGITIVIDADRFATDDDTVWWVIFPENTTLDGANQAAQIANIKSGAAATGMKEGATIMASAAGIITPVPAADADGNRTVMGNIVPALTGDAKYDVFMVIGGGVRDTLLVKEANIPATNLGCSADDVLADCDGDTVANGMDNCPAVANMNQLNTDNPNGETVGGDAFGDVCDDDVDNDGVNDFAADGTTILDKFPLNACAAFNSDSDVLPDDILDPAASGSDRCDPAALDALIAILVVTIDTCVDRDSCTDADDDGDGAADASDVDLDNDGLIEIATLEALNNIRYNLAGTTYDDEADDGTNNLGSTSGAPTTEQPACDDGDSNTTLLLCGYELTRNLDFAVAASYANNTVSSAWCPGPKTGDTPCVPASPDAAMPGFVPIGTQANDFVAILDGNLFTINNLYIHNDTDTSGLLGSIDGGTIRRLGLTNVSVSGVNNIGGLAGESNDATITAVGVSGTVTGSSNNVAGLIGSISGNTISGSWSSVAVTNNSSFTGGLIGLVATTTNNISLSYARGSVISAVGQDSGGLIGGVLGSITTIRSSWVSVEVSGGSNHGAVIGNRGLQSASVTLSNFYRSTGATFPSSDVGLLSGTLTGSVTGLTTDQMQAVDGANFGGSSAADRFGTGCGGAWVFSDATTTHFPKLREIISGADTPADCSDDTYGDELPGQ